LQAPPKTKSGKVFPMPLQASLNTKAVKRVVRRKKMISNKPKRPKRKEFVQKKRSVKTHDGYIMKHVTTTGDEKEVNRIDAHFKRQKKEPGIDYRIEKNGNVWEIFVRK